MKNNMIGKLLIMALILFFVISCAASASIISLKLSFEYSGATEPAGTSPWLTATFDDQGTPGSVMLLLENTNLIDLEHTKGWYLNLDPLLNPSLLSFTETGRTGAFDTPGISKGINSFKADGDGYYDILLTFANGGDLSNRFGAGDSLGYEITGISSLLASSFHFISEPNGGAGEYLSAAHVGGIYNTESGWIAVPEPASLWFLTLGGAFMIRRSKKRLV